MDAYIYTSLIFCFAGFAQGITGFGSALVAVPLLTLFMGIKVAAPLCVLSGVVLTGNMTLRLRKELEFGKSAPILLGMAPGVIVGALLLTEVNEVLLKALLGVVLIGYPAYCILFTFRPRSISRFWGLASGFLAGAIGTAVSTGGPPVVIYVSLTDWSKDKIKATLSSCFFIGGLFSATAHIISGVTTAQVIGLFVVALPSILIGSCMGLAVGARLSDNNYKRALYVMLSGLGVMLLFQAFFVRV